MLKMLRVIQVGFAICTAISISYRYIAERLVHGPLMALMLLETVNFHHKNLILRSFDYRARNPVFVDRPVMIHGVWLDKFSGELWTLDEDGVVGMTGSIVLTQPKS